MAIGKSKMPKLQHHLAQLHGVALEYLPYDLEHIATTDPLEYILSLKAEGIDGLNVTHPFKQSVVPLVTRPVEPKHAAVGAYNTLLFRDGDIFGGNTDFSGFLEAWRYRFAEQSPGNVLLVGAGGVGHAIGHALLQLGALRILIADLDRSKAETLRTSLLGSNADVEVIETAAIGDHMQYCDGLVNCTTVGTARQPGNPFPAEHTGSQRWAFDAVYTPLHTAFVHQCRKDGLATLTGFDLWIFQGIDAFNLFTDEAISADETLLATAQSWLD